MEHRHPVRKVASNVVTNDFGTLKGILFRKNISFTSWFSYVVSLLANNDERMLEVLEESRHHRAFLGVITQATKPEAIPPSMVGNTMDLFDIMESMSPLNKLQESTDYDNVVHL